MDKKLRKVIQSMRPYIGQQIIRIAPAIYPSGVGVKDYSYGSEPVILRGFSSKGEARITRSDKQNRHAHNCSISFTDRNWILYSDISCTGKSRLNKWRGRRIKRIRATKLGDRSFMSEEGVELIWATPYHVNISWNFMGEPRECLLNSLYAAPEDWVPVE